MILSLSQVSGQDKSDTWIVSYKMGVTPDLISLKQAGEVVEAECIFPAINLWSIETKTTSTKAKALALIGNNTDVRFIEPNITAEWRRMPNDPDFALQWGMKKIGMEEVWDITTGGQAPNGDDIVIAIFDDGFQVDHRDYAENVWVNEQEIQNNGIDDDGNGFVDDYYGWNSTKENDNHDELNHGTSVAGIIGAKGDNQSLMAGMNWTAKMMLTSGGSQAGVDLRDIVKAYNYVFAQRQLYNATNGAMGSFVVALSYSGGAEKKFPVDFPAWCEVIDALGSVGVLTVGAGPNTNTNIDEEGDLPGTCPSNFLITVTNTNRFDSKTNPAGFGPTHVDLGAPGDGIFTLAIGDDVDASFFGTSAAAPFVGGLIPLMYSVICDDAMEMTMQDPAGMALIMRSAILNNVDVNVELNNVVATGGRLNAFKALKSIDESLGNCCEVTIDDVLITDETCLDADDGQVVILAIGQDLNGPLQYELQGAGLKRNELGNFTRLEAIEYELSVYDPVDGQCKADTIIQVMPSDLECPFGAFAITGLVQQPGTVQIEYSIDQQKDLQIQIHDSLGRLMYDMIVRPELSGTRAHSINTSAFPDGTYHASILATGFRDVESFIVVN